MEETLSNQKLFESKLSLANSQTWRALLNQSSFPVKVNYQGVPLKFHFYEKSDQQKFLNFIPSAWLTESPFSISLHFLSPKDFSQIQSDWDDEAYSECILREGQNGRICIQRDFVGIEESQGQYIFFCHDVLDDGFFNALRWLLPIKLPLQGRSLLHSSCVVRDDGRAIFFLGHSGAGKTTIASLAGDRVVLGDDMNILHWNQNSLYASPGAVGGTITCEKNLDLKVEVAAMYWLEQSDESSFSPLKKSLAAQKLLSSCANIFWRQANPYLEEILFKMSLKVTSLIPFYQLKFQKNEEVWNVLDPQ